MTLGLPTMHTGRTYDDSDYRRLMDIAERGGIDGFALGDHANWHNPTNECLVTLAWLCGLTDRPLLANVVVAPLRQPFALAKAATTVACLGRGTFRLGLGVGGEHEREFLAAGVRRSERGSRTDELLSVTAELLAGETVNHRGVHYEVTAAKVDPCPKIPVLIGGRSDKALQRVIRHRTGWSAAWVTAEGLERSIQRLADLSAADAPSAPHSPYVAAHTRIRIGESTGQAWSDASRFLVDHYGGEPESYRRHTVVGNAREVADRLLDFAAIGVDELIVTFASENQTSQLERFCSDVLPSIRPLPRRRSP